LGKAAAFTSLRWRGKNDYQGRSTRSQIAPTGYGRRRGKARHIAFRQASVIGALPGASSSSSNGQKESAMTAKYLRYGHAPGHIRDTFCDAVHAYMDWKDGAPGPAVEYEVNYVPRQISISKACRLVWHCTDIIPGQLFDWVRDDAELDIRRQTYAAVAQAIYADIHHG
jgi:hypothetical protein